MAQRENNLQGWTRTSVILSFNCLVPLLVAFELVKHLFVSLSETENMSEKILFSDREGLTFDACIFHL